MSDFLLQVGRGSKAGPLLEIQRAALGKSCNDAIAREFGWGCVAVVQEQGAKHHNAISEESRLVAWVGDLIISREPSVTVFLSRLFDSVRSRLTEGDPRLSELECLKALNGAFAVLLADDDGFCIITDPLGAVQVYKAEGRSGAFDSFGTNADWVAVLSNRSADIDPVSVYEFLHIGTPCFPRTMYEGVTELKPGRIVAVFPDIDVERTMTSEHVYWSLPGEERAGQSDILDNLTSAFQAAVEERCIDGAIGVTLSGGLDSRVVLACIPKERNCKTFTYGDRMNREARHARRAAACYGRPWIPLIRDPEHNAQTILEAVRYIGCECDAICAQGLPFQSALSENGIQCLLTGLLMDNNLKGYYASDLGRVVRLGGLMSPRFEIRPANHFGPLEEFGKEIFYDSLKLKAVERRTAFIGNHPGRGRESPSEWLDGYPFSQASDNTQWVAERRKIPIRLPAADRRLLEIACSIPLLTKVENRIFERMAVRLLGPGAQIPSANDGVCPGSSHLKRLMQRAARKVEDRGRDALKRMGFPLSVPHSWHDYQRYWQTSRMLQSLAVEYGDNLVQFQDSVFRLDPRKLLVDKSLHWKRGFRLVQLAVWCSIVENYRISTTPPIATTS